jgi:hypothetical protein
MLITAMLLLSMTPQEAATPNVAADAPAKLCKRIVLPRQQSSKRRLICATQQEWDQYARWQQAEYYRARRENFSVSGL